MDEIGFGPRREARPRSRRPRWHGPRWHGPRSHRRRAIVAAASIASAAAAAAVALTVTLASSQHGVTPPPAAIQSAALPATVIGPPSADCAPVHPTWPSLAVLPAGLRLGALPIVVDEQFSGRCPAR